MEQISRLPVKWFYCWIKIRLSPKANRSFHEIAANTLFTPWESHCTFAFIPWHPTSLLKFHKNILNFPAKIYYNYWPKLQNNQENAIAKIF